VLLTAVLAALLTSPGLCEDLPVVSDSALSSAISVETGLYCSESRFRKPEVTVAWKINAADLPEGSVPKDFIAAEQVRIDITSAPNGLEIGRYESVSVDARKNASADGAYAIGPGGSSVRFLDLRPGVIYYVRALVRTDSGWIASEPTRFLSPTCPVDGLDDEKGAGR